MIFTEFKEMVPVQENIRSELKIILRSEVTELKCLVSETKDSMKVLDSKIIIFEEKIVRS